MGSCKGHREPTSNGTTLEIHRGGGAGGQTYIWEKLKRYPSQHIALAGFDSFVLQLQTEMTSFQHFTILFQGVNLFKHSKKITKRPGKKKKIQFSLVLCLVFLGGCLVGNLFFLGFMLKVTFPPPSAAAPNSSGRSKRPVRGPAMMAPTKAPTPPAALGLAGCTRKGGLTVLLPAKKLMSQPQLWKSTCLTMLKRHFTSQANQDMIKHIIAFVPKQKVSANHGIWAFRGRKLKISDLQKFEFQPKH